MLKKASLILLIFISFVIVSIPSYADESKEQYTVGVDDVLTITVSGHDDLRTTATVSSDGSISFPYLGTITVRGMNLSEIEKEITKRLASGYIKYPVVSVTLSTSKSLKFFVYGEVKSTGRYLLEADMTVLKAISTAGGITPDGLYGNVKLRRKQKGKEEYKEIDIALGSKKEGKASADMPIQAEDIVTIERNRNFFVYGEVLKPGKFTLEDNMTILKAISLAGGFAKYGSPDRVKILRTLPGKTEYESIKVNIKDAIRGQAGKDIPLEPEDVVIASEGRL